MNFTNLAIKRQSVRKYTDKLIDQDNIDKIIESCRISPSASNSQPWHIIIANDKDIKDKVANATFSKTVSFNKFATQAAAIAVIVIEKPRLKAQIGAYLKNREFPLIDIGILASHFCLKATELGIGTCILGWFNESKIKNILKIPRKKRIGLVITLGYAPEEYPQREKIRKNTSEIISFNSY